MAEKWMIKNKATDFKALCDKFGINEVVARIMVNRNVPEARMEEYLHPGVEYMHAPELLKDSVKTVRILKEKIEERKKIRVIGDYDVDGVTSTYILMTALRECGADADYAIPERIRDGYGINIRMVEEAVADGVDTILTCDNGIAAVEQTRYAKEHGLTVLITDHHELQEVLPEADAIVNQKQPDCNYPEREICGGVIAYKIAELLYETVLGKREAVKKLLPFAAIATVCDVMPLTGENRTIVSIGLEMLRNTTHSGILALMQVNQLDPKALVSYHLGFILGPCLNATGRLETAERGVRLLMADNEEEALKLASELKELNAQRKEMTALGTDEAKRQVEAMGNLIPKVLVIYLPECHESLAGIIAGRIREAYNRPVIILTKAENGLKGSGRSTEFYPMFERLSECKELLSKFGGHPMAAGLSLPEENLEKFRLYLNDNCQMTDEMLEEKVSIDVVLSLSYLSEQLIDEMSVLEPFGKDNEKPIFAERKLKLLRMSAFGKNSKMLRFVVEDSHGTQMEAVYFGDGEKMENDLASRYGDDCVRALYQGRATGATMSVIYYPNINEYRGVRSLQIVIQKYLL